MGGIAFRGDDPPSFPPSAEIGFSHQASYPLARDLASLIREITTDAWTPIPALMGMKYLPNFLPELSIFLLAPAGGTLAPGIKAAF